MVNQIFLNLPVKNLPETMAFFTELGFEFNMQFTDENAACLILGDNIFAMLLTEPFFNTFTTKRIADTATTAAAIFAMSVDDRHKVDAMIASAIQAGGHESRPAQDHGWMYGRSFTDLDGHNWEVFFMDASAMPAPAEAVRQEA